MGRDEVGPLPHPEEDDQSEDDHIEKRAPQEEGAEDEGDIESPEDCALS